MNMLAEEKLQNECSHRRKIHYTHPENPEYMMVVMVLMEAFILKRNAAFPPFLYNAELTLH